MEIVVLVADNELLGKFIVKEDEAAFEELVRRHSPMVMGVCKSMLLHAQDSEDAFQATFLVLSKKANRLLNRSSIAGWLYEVALRNCLEVRRQRRRTRESEMIEDPFSEASEPWLVISKAQEFDKIHGEIKRLPKRYRDVIILCHLQGRSRSEAAELLQTTTSAVKAALARGRNLLRQRLVRQGIVVTALILALRETTTVAAESIEEPLIESTLQLCHGSESTTSIGSSAEFVKTLANSGAQNMNPIGLGQICSFAAAVAVAIAIPVTIYAQQTEQLNGREITLNVTDASDSQDNSIDIAGDSFAETSQETDILGTVGSIPDSSISAETSTATDSRPEQPTEQTESADPASYLPENSSDYWAAIKKAYETKADILRQQRDSGLGNPFAMFEYHEARAKVIEADLHLKRIAKGVIKRTYPFQQIPLDNSVNLPEQATSRPPETVNENVPPASSDPVVPGEELTIESMSDDTFNRRVVVQADHTIRLPMVGTVPVKHQTTEQIARHLESLYGRYIKNAAFFVARARASSPLELDRSRLK